MAFKLELEQWQSACEAFDNNDHDTALRLFHRMADNAKMYFNIGLIHASINDHERAIAAYTSSISLDPFFAVAYFQMGVSYFALNDMVNAKQAFDEAHKKLRGNQIINYHQLGLAFRLYACEILFNRGICQLHLGKIDAGLTDLYHAQKAKMTEEHDIIDQAVRDRGKGYSVYAIPSGVLYRPSETRLRQMRGEHDGTDMFVAMDRLGLSNKRSHNNLAAAAAAAAAASGGTAMVRNNSVLLGSSHRLNAAPTPTATYSTPASRSYSPSPSFEPRRKASHIASDDFSESTPSILSSTSSSFSSSLRYRSDGRRVDSGFESTTDDRHSSASSLGRYSAKSQRINSHTLPPVPPMPHSACQNIPDDGLDATTYSTLDRDRHDSCDTLSSLSLHDSMSERDRIRQRLNSNATLHDHNSQRGSYQSAGRSFSPLPSPLPVRDTNSTIKIKVHYTDTRVLLVPASITFDDLFTRIQQKFNAPDSLRIQYKDEDDEMVLMIDDDDLNMARHMSRQRNEGPMEKLEVWCIT